MAGDWIKMRCDLQTHPKVVRIASALNADRLRVVGGLHAVWSLFDAHSDDGRLDGYSPDVVDSLIGWPGFSAAMHKVGWMSFENDAMSLPRFEDHNGQSAKRRGQESARKRDARAQSKRTDVPKVSAPDADVGADKSGTREEKRREEKNTAPAAPKNPSLVAFTLPDWVDPVAWKAWLEIRSKKRAPNTDHALHLALRELEKLKRDGNDPKAVLNQSTLRGWQGLFPLKDSPNGGPQAPAQPERYGRTL